MRKRESRGVAVLRAIVFVVLFVVFFGAVSGPSRAASAQLYYDPFGYSASTTIPNWSTEFGGDWVATGRQVQSDVRFGWQFLLRDNVFDQDCVVDSVVSYSFPFNTQFGGPCARARIDNNSLITYIAKIQDNVRGGSGTFNRAFLLLYQSPLGFFGLATIDTIPSTMVRTRLLVTDETNTNQVRVMGFFDLNMDGIWDVRLVAFNVSLGKVSGQPGLSAFAATFQDDFRFYNAVLWETTGQPSPGTVVEYNARGSPGAQYIAACSLSNIGFRAGGVTVPLRPDVLFALSLQVPSVFQNFTGTIDMNGDAPRLRVVLPNSQRLIGIAYYTAFVTISGSQILEVSNDSQVLIGP